MLSTRHTFNWLIAMDAGVLRRPLLLALYQHPFRSRAAVAPLPPVTCIGLIAEAGTGGSRPNQHQGAIPDAFAESPGLRPLR